MCLPCLIQKGMHTCLVPADTPAQAVVTAALALSKSHKAAVEELEGAINAAVADVADGPVRRAAQRVVWRRRGAARALLWCCSSAWCVLRGGNDPDSFAVLPLLWVRRWIRLGT